jgi:hypothetical protein
MKSMTMHTNRAQGEHDHELSLCNARPTITIAIATNIQITQGKKCQLKFYQHQQSLGKHDRKHQ